MCGIAGEINYKRGIDLSVINAMSEALTPRGPDADGIFRSECAVLAHRRLIVIDPENGAQPMTAGDFTLVYNGELYNTEEIRAGLSKRGVTFFGHSDTEVVLKAFIEYGEECLRLFNGIYAFAVWNKRTRRLFLARDRIGVKPLFYAVTRGGLIFASEIKALLCHPEVSPIITGEGAAEIMLIGPAKITGSGVFRDISEIPAACFMWADENGTDIRKYWELYAERHTESLEETTGHLRELLFDSIKRQLVSDVGLCTFLSGGLDSSIISAVAAREFAERGEKLHTYSIDYKNNRENFRASAFQPDEDAPYVIEMAEYLGTEHTDVVLDTPALADALEDSTYARDLPGMADVDSSLWLFCREIKKDFSVAVSGEAADEVFGGYPWYHRPEVLHYDGFPWATSVPERGALMRKPLSGAEAESFVRRAYDRCLENVSYLDGESPDERRMREMFVLNLNYFMVTLLEANDTKENSLEGLFVFCFRRAELTGAFGGAGFWKRGSVCGGGGTEARKTTQNVGK